MQQSFDFFDLIGRLKRVKRTGWVDCGIQDPESVADHMYRMALMVMLLPTDPGISTSRALRMALVHDLQEALVGDITPEPWSGVSKAEKHKLEVDAIERIRVMLHPAPFADELVELWEEYEAAATPEAKLVKDLDKFEMMMQAHEYEQQDPSLSLQQFFDHVRDTHTFTHPIVKEWVQKLDHE